MPKLNLVRNGEVEFWGAGPLPSFMAAQLTNTALEILDNGDPYQWPRRFAFGVANSRDERYVGEGMRSLRANVGAAAAVDAFRLNPLNVAPLAWTGATAPAVVLTPGAPYQFSFLCRNSVRGNSVRVRVVFRDPGGVVRLSLASAIGDITAAATAVDLRVSPFWRTYVVRFVAPATDDAGNMIDSVVWQISNATAAAQLLDIDDIRMGRSDDGAAE